MKKKDLYKPEPLDRSKHKGYVMDEYGWVLIENGPPHSNHCFEIVTIRYEDGFEQTGWWTGYKWDMGRKRYRCKVEKWRFKDTKEKNIKIKEDVTWP